MVILFPSDAVAKLFSQLDLQETCRELYAEEVTVIRRGCLCFGCFGLHILLFRMPAGRSAVNSELTLKTHERERLATLTIVIVVQSEGFFQV
jgi:hypothetical protein